MRGVLPPLPQYVFMAWLLIKQETYLHGMAWHGMSWYLVKHRENITLNDLTQL
jgi:hypothetical protein